MTRARDVSRLITTPASAYIEYDEVVVSSASPSSSTPIWIDTTTASAPAIKTYALDKWVGTRLTDLDLISADYLVIGGGGGAGSQSGGGGGGGGAGGYRNSFGTEASGGGGSTEAKLTLCLRACWTGT
jgi:hypothetical protein